MAHKYSGTFRLVNASYGNKDLRCDQRSRSSLFDQELNRNLALLNEPVDGLLNIRYRFLVLSGVINGRSAIIPSSS